MPALNPIVLIPARLGAARLPNKPLADIHGEPMVAHVWRQAEATIGSVAVACCGIEIEKAVQQVGGRAVITDPALPSGTDRIYAALQQIEADASHQEPHDIIINLQGDLPTVSPALLRQVLVPLANPAVDIATIAAPIMDAAELRNPNVVKIALTEPQKSTDGVPVGRALYFSRSLIPAEGTVHYHHIGIYAYRRKALEAYVKLPVSSLEKAERLEQLRALEAGMRIDVAIVDDVPLSVDTLEDLERVREFLAT